MTSNKNSRFETIAQYLTQNEAYYVKTWEDNILIDTMDDQVRQNGYMMLKIVIKSLIEGLSLSDLKHLAYKVAKEKVEANSNIGEFVYNVNLGRSIIIKYVFKSGIKLEELEPVIELINEQFDHFCYFAVTHYTKLKDKELQEKNLYIRQTHKDRLALLGQMSSSFVHEFRNPLTSVIGFIKLLRNDHPELKYLDIIDLELDQLNFRITQFLHTSKMHIVTEERMENVSLKTLIDEIINFLYPSIVDRDINIITNINNECMIKVVKNEWKQVFLNIIMNSIDAVTLNKKKKEVTVNCDLIKEHIIITVSNNGPAIPNETRKTIFEPFYTTKELGTGIGLYVCKNIIEKYNGTITCSSNDEFTTFTIFLPLNK
ncbi:histidine kinase N-terminal domain-containing protein [Anaerobacillus sp. MEB173]|uniref:histidine kinase N-terminal domain-containing protein n=1 Tax=Anaerobacillus sp. MEB173 TaxID=3383345 RepID=UPI003F8F268E